MTVDEPMIFDQVAEIMNKDSARKIEKETGLNREKVRRMAQGLPFVLDYNTVFAVKRCGFVFKLEKIDTRNCQ